ncbi:MAG: hypothetical protein D6711_09780 [Chloroflexi bacterium]|nr:MAG: hypothetical protein D6711_09780 [Chloroflexota bacterium]
MLNKLPLPYETHRGKVTFPKFLLAVLAGSLFACWLTWIIYFAVFFLLHNLSWLEMPRLFPWIIFIILAVLGVVNELLSSIRHLKIDQNKIAWTKFGGREIIISRENIKAISWQGEKITFETAVERHTLNLSKFPLKEQVIINHLIIRWVPIHALSSELQLAIESQAALLNENPENIQQASAQTNFRKLRAFRAVSFVCMGIMFVVISITFRKNSSSSLLFPVSLLSMIILFISWIIWQLTNNRVIQVDDKGIHYIVGSRKQQRTWNEIEVVLFQIGAQRILVWNGNRYKALYYNGMDNDEVNHLAGTLEKYLLTHGIAYAYG